MSSRLSTIRNCTTLLWVVLHRVYRSEGKECDLSFIAASILYSSSHYQMCMQDLAKLNGVSKSTVTDYVDNLEQKGYVRRVRDEKDKRSMYIEPTEKGREWVARNEEKILAYLEACADNLSPEELEMFTMLFAKFVGGVGRVPFSALFEQAATLKIE